MRGIQEKIRKRAFMDQGSAEGGLGQPMSTANAGDEESAFINQIATIMKTYMESKFPWLRSESVLNILDIDMDKNTVTASYDLILGEKNVRIPLLFQNGNIIKPWTIFLEDEKRMYPLSEKWYKKIINALTDDLGVVDPLSSSAYWNAANTSNQVLNSNVVRGVRGYHYAALNKLTLMELMPIVKQSMLNGYVYDHVGRTAIKVAAQKYIASRLKQTKKTSKLKLNSGAFIITKDTLKKVSGLSFRENAALYDKLAKQEWCLHYKGSIAKKAEMVDIVSVVDERDDVAHSINSSFMLNHPVMLWGSYNKYTGAPLYLVPNADEQTLSARKTFKNENYKLEEVGGLWNKTIILNPEAAEDFEKLIESIRLKEIPAGLKSIIESGEEPTGAERDKCEVLYVIPVNMKKQVYLSRFFAGSEGDYSALADKYDIYGTEDGYLKSMKNDLKFALVPEKTANQFITSDAEAFVRKAPSLEEYVRGNFNVKKNYNSTYDMDFAATGSKSASIKNVDKKIASFILANYVNVPAADEFLDKNIEYVGKQYKFAAQIDPETQNQIMAAIQQIGSMISNLESPEDQKQVLDNSGKGGGITVNIDTLNIGGAQEGAVPAEGMPVEGAPAGAEPMAAGAEGQPSLDELIGELTNLGIPPEMVDQILQAAELIGTDPTQLVIEVGAFVENSTAQGIPMNQILSVLQEKLGSITATAGAPGMENIAGAANTPYPTEAPMEGMQEMPAATDTMMQQAGQQMVQEMPPAAPAQMPVTEAMANPDLQQVASVPGMGGMESINKGVLADIISNATIKTKFIDYLPVLNDTVNAISEMLLKIELNRNRLTNEVGTANIDDVVETLRNVLDQLGSLILQIAQFE